MTMTTASSTPRTGVLSTAVLIVASVVGAAGFLYPFLLPAVDAGTRQADETQAQATLAPVLFAVVTAFSLVAMIVTIADDHGGVARSKMVALLGVLVAIDATLRLVPSVLGASPIFLLIMLVGAVFGSSVGFQMGTLTLLMSAFLTGGIGPWLPFQMLVAGWVGLTAGWLPRAVSERRRIAMLAAFGAAWGLGFGMLMNLWFWPFSAPGVDTDAGLYWVPGGGPLDTLERYARFYVVTSLGFDLFRAAGNVVLMLLLGGPVLRLLERYRQRFSWEPWTEFPPDEAVTPAGRGGEGRDVESRPANP